MFPPLLQFSIARASCISMLSLNRPLLKFPRALNGIPVYHKGSSGEVSARGVE